MRASRRSTKASFPFLAGRGIHHEFFRDHGGLTYLGDISLDWKQELSKYDASVWRLLYPATSRGHSRSIRRVGGRFTYQRNRFKAGYEHDFSSQWSGRMRYENEFVWFADNIFDDSMMHSVGGRFF